jgi:photosystem II stability/assembly factor-like uncharacterized protein
MIYIGTDNGIYRWFPGASWPIFHGLQERAVLDLVSPGGGVMVAVDGQGRIWETIDNGQEWREVSPPEDSDRPTALALVDTPASLVLASRPLALHRRGIGPDPAEVKPNALDLADRQVSAMIELAARLARRRRQGTEGGLAVAEPPVGRIDTMGWVTLGQPAAAPEGVEPRIRRIEAGPNAWFAAVVGAGLWRSTDAGSTWQECPGLPTEVYAIRISQGLVALATSDGCWMSSNDGETWEDHSGGLDACRHVRAIEIRPGNPNVLLAGAAPDAPGQGPAAPRGGLGFALFESKDGGKTWTRVTRGFPEALEFDTIADIRYEPTNPEYAVIALSSGELWNTRSDGLWWEPLARQINSARVLCASE